MACAKSCRSFDAVEDAKVLEKAMKGLGTDEKAIIEVLTYRSAAQRREIEAAYKAQFGKDLKRELHSELSGNFRQAVLWSFGDRAHVNAQALFKAIDRPGTDERMLVDVLCTATNEEIQEIKEAYQDVLIQNKKNTSKRNLEEDVRSDTSGDFRKVLIALLQASREEGCDEAQAKEDCEALYQGGEAKLGTDEETFTRIFCTRSWKQLRRINELYIENYGHDLIKAISKETSGDYKMALTRIMETAHSVKKTVAEMLYKSMKGAGTNDDNLIRIILAYSEHNLARIREIFDITYEKTLVKMIEGDTSGDYRRYLLAILG
ncbi:unnamed protein product [Mesocestoides corti]|uniref:Annexin n=1 Tax=Mesocestoides corti TaxID=53468 RepID=A0A0R3UJ25_MESCO|nr:unnamed protein product [Mesocestoides corti]